MKTRIGLPAFVLAALLFLGLPPASSSADVAVAIGIAPPPIAVYAQPLCPGPGYIWVPGYWAYDYGYYWVPGEWVLPPRIGFLWTPGYWGYSGGSYIFNDGYWGPSVGFYGGINYGNGYYGNDYYGGRWVGDNFYYNTAASRVNPNVIQNTYVDRQVVQSTTGARASFNGPGGIQAAPSVREQALANAEHVAPTSAQQSRVAAAKNDPALRTADNKGQPKANAVRTFESKQRSTGADTAAAAKNDSVNTPAGAKNGSVNTAAGAKNGSVKTARNERVATSHARNSTQARHSGSRKGASASYAGRHQQAAVHHQRMASSYPRHVAPHSQRTASYRQQASHGGQRVASQGKGGGGGGKKRAGKGKG